VVARKFQVPIPNFLLFRFWRIGRGAEFFKYSNSEPEVLGPKASSRFAFGNDYFVEVLGVRKGPNLNSELP